MRVACIELLLVISPLLTAMGDSHAEPTHTAMPLSDLTAAEWDDDWDWDPLAKPADHAHTGSQAAGVHVQQSPGQAGGLCAGCFAGLLHLHLLGILICHWQWQS